MSMLSYMKTVRIMLYYIKAIFLCGIFLIPILSSEAIDKWKNTLLCIFLLCFLFFRDKKHMADDVSDAVVDILSMEMEADKLEAIKILAMLREAKQYLQDVWS